MIIKTNCIYVQNQIINKLKLQVNKVFNRLIQKIYAMQKFIKENIFSHQLKSKPVKNNMIKFSWNKNLINKIISILSHLNNVKFQPSDNKN